MFGNIVVNVIMNILYNNCPKRDDLGVLMLLSLIYKPVFFRLSVFRH